MKVVEFENVEKSFGMARVLKGISFDVLRGERVALFGPNGSGKTTIVKLMAGLLKATKGKVKVFGKEVDEEVKRKIGVVSHNTFLYDDLTAYENLRFFSRIYDADESRIDDLLRIFGLWQKRNDFVKNYSRGMKQRLSIARALLNNPELLILDEPTTALDIEGRKILFEILHEFDGTIIIATHLIDDARKLCERVIVIDGGVIKFDGDL